MATQSRVPTLHALWADAGWKNPFSGFFVKRRSPDTPRRGRPPYGTQRAQSGEPGPFQRELSACVPAGRIGTTRRVCAGPAASQPLSHRER